MREPREPENNELLFWEPEENGAIRCQACARGCRILPGTAGYCGVRENRDGRLHLPWHGVVSTLQADPMEKKPLAYFLPGTKVLSVGTWGCNLHCPWCQNWTIAQRRPDVPPKAETAESLVRLCLEGGYPSLAFTYNEPTIHLEFVLETFALARKKGLKTVFVTNGNLSALARRALVPWTDAANVDLKGYSATRLRESAGGDLESEKACIEEFWRRGVHTEVTTLVIPGWSDDLEVLAQAAGWLAALSPDLPWHLTAFFPQNKMLDTPITPLATLQLAEKAARKAGLRRVILGNTRGLK